MISPTTRRFQGAGKPPEFSVRSAGPPFFLFGPQLQQLIYESKAKAVCGKGEWPYGSLISGPLRRENC